MAILLQILRKFGNVFFPAKRLWELASLWHFDRSCRNIDNAPPIPVGESKYAVVSMLRHSDVTQYLVAMRSFAACTAPPAEIHIVNDSSLTNGDIARLKRHIPHLKIVHISQIDTGECPVGGTWERLKYIIDVSQNIYAIQMDADIFSRQSLEDVEDAVKRNIPFLLGTEMPGSDNGKKIISLCEASDYAETLTGVHVQVSVERLLRQLTLPQQKYLRASSGFAGFAKKSVSWQTARDFSGQMEKLLKSDQFPWTTWGTEQITSNFVLANAPDAIVLTAPEYINHDGSPMGDRERLIHFLGFARFENDAYRTLALKFIEETA